MGEITGIEWCDHTFNAWVGCTKVSLACDGCYAEEWAKRFGHPELWNGERRRTTAAYWRQPLKWNAEAQRIGVRRKVFCCSLADVFDNKVPIEWLVDLFDMIFECRWLDWLLLTKRPQNVRKRLEAAGEAGAGIISGMVWQWLSGDNPPGNIWLGTTVENQAEADRRIPHLLAIPAAKRFLSCEPLLGEVDVSNWLFGGDPPCAVCPRDIDCECGWKGRAELGRDDALHWIIAGGESGPEARPMRPEWARALRDQCAAAGVPFFFKQRGEWTWVDDADFDADRIPEGLPFKLSDDEPMWRVGKKKAGALLDGCGHREFPA